MSLWRGARIDNSTLQVQDFTYHAINAHKQGTCIALLFIKLVAMCGTNCRGDWEGPGRG
jgi:hypothetical protein